MTEGDTVSVVVVKTKLAADVDTVGAVVLDTELAADSDSVDAVVVDTELAVDVDTVGAVGGDTKLAAGVVILVNIDPARGARVSPRQKPTREKHSNLKHGILEVVQSCW